MGFHPTLRSGHLLVLFYQSNVFAVYIITRLPPNNKSTKAYQQNFRHM